MLETLLVLIGFQLAGEALGVALALPVPGAVLGMMLLFAFLMLRRGVPRALQQGVPALLQHFSLFFIPAGLGVVLYSKLLGESWWQMVVALVVGTLVTFIVSAGLLHRLMVLSRARRRAARRAGV